ncbi:hypothetical protein HBI47_241710 [Parastagonospora nodorum]|nr:hypothetical protein HBI47_241710 [Parastagonospora nodorum]
MCHKLISVYACNHSKIICTTPCPYALDTGGRIPRRKCNDQDLSCSDSTVSSLAPSIRLEEHPAQLRSPPASRPGLPLPTPQQISQQSTKIASAPSFRFIPRAPSPSHIGSPSPGYTPHSPESEHSLQTSPSAALLPDEQFDIDPNFCDYHFPHNLPTSKLPCKECYMFPAWQHLAPLYMKYYCEQHPMVKPEDLESLAGIKDLREEHERRVGRGM